MERSESDRPSSVADVSKNHGIASVIVYKSFYFRKSVEFSSTHNQMNRVLFTALPSTYFTLSCTITV
jgi:hypothetical protein